MERSDLPEGQQSKESVRVFTKIGDEWHLDTAESTAAIPAVAAEVARVRAQTAEDIARELERIAESEQTPMAYQYRHAMRTAARVARSHAGKAFPSSPAALPDVVGTPELPRLAAALHARGVLVDGDVVDEAIAYMDRLHDRYVREVDARHIADEAGTPDHPEG